MSDGRFVTSYVDSDILNQFIRHVNELGSAQDFKNFLQKNAVEIMDKERNFLVSKNTCNVVGKCNPDAEGFANTNQALGEVNIDNFKVGKCNSGCDNKD